MRSALSLKTLRIPATGIMRRIASGRLDDWLDEKRIVDEEAKKPDGWDEEVRQSRVH